MRNAIAFSSGLIWVCLLAFPDRLLSQTAPGVARSVQLDGANVHYTDYGAGENALLFVHGWSPWCVRWKRPKRCTNWSSAAT